MKRAFALLVVALLTRCWPHLIAAEDAFAKWEPEIQKFEAADRAQIPPKNAILFVGSSSIRFWTNLVESFPRKKIIQRGFGGSTMADALHFADRIILPYKPKQIFVYEGDNDLAAGRSTEMIVADYKALVQKIHAQLPKTKVWFIAIKPSPSRWKFELQARAANEEILRWSKSEKNTGYIDVWNPMLGADGKPRPELFREDNLHMNATGYALWAK